MAEELEKIFQALGNKDRLEIIRLILKKKEISCQELLGQFFLSQPTMSHHFGLLLASGVIDSRKDGVRHFYRVNVKKLKALGVNVDKFKMRNLNG